MKHYRIIYFPALLAIPPEQFKLVLDSIIWAFKHTMRNVADTGMLLFKSYNFFFVHVGISLNFLRRFE